VANPGDKARSALAPALSVACATLLALAACKVVRDDERDKSAQGSVETHAEGFDATAWAASVWGPKVVPYYDKDAVDLAPVLAALKQDPDEAGKKFGRRADTEGSPWTFAVKARGTVVSVDTESRAGTIVVAVDSPSGPENVTLQIGPVVRGTAVRDSLPFFSFGDVNNQIQFAQVSRALNDRAMAAIQPAVAALKAPGTPVEFAGALNVSGAVDTVLITPISLRRAGGK
jgi:predicted lipoprotein